MRRGRASLFGSGYSVIFSVFGSRRPRFGALNSSKYGTPFESTMIPYGPDLEVGGDTSVILPVLGSSVPTKLPACTVEYINPSLLNAIVWGSRALGLGILYSVILPVFGSIFPFNPTAFPVFQMLPAVS